VGWRSLVVRNHPSSTVQKFHHRHGRSTNGDCVQALPNVSEALDRRVLSGEPARTISVHQWTRVALLSNLLSRYRPRITSHEQAAVHRLAEHGPVPR
jgi:hypothetical protein